jgi:hypothetical protein
MLLVRPHLMLAISGIATVVLSRAAVTPLAFLLHGVASAPRIVAQAPQGWEAIAGGETGAPGHARASDPTRDRSAMIGESSTMQTIAQSPVIATSLVAAVNTPRRSPAVARPVRSSVLPAIPATSSFNRRLLQALASGKDGQVLIMRNGTPVWSDPPPVTHATAPVAVPATDRSAGGRRGGGTPIPENTDGKLEHHDHQSDANGGVLEGKCNHSEVTQNTVP